MFIENLLSDVIYYKINKCEKVVLKKCTILNEFVYSRVNFILCKSKQNYLICASKDGDIYMLKDYPIKDENGNDYSPSEIMSLFRKEFSKNEITKDMVDLFLNKPLSFKRKYFRK